MGELNWLTKKRLIGFPVFARVLSLPSQWEATIVKVDDELSTFRMTLHGKMIQV
jgi:hypothetical protein